MTAPAIRFDHGPHHYIDTATGEALPGITTLLKQTGDLDDRWFNAEGSARGSWVHARAAEFDLGLLERPELVVHEWKPYLLAHVACMRQLQPEILHVEEIWPHPTHRYVSRIDRVLKLRGVRGVWELKTGDKEKWHPLQTALEAILDSVYSGIPPVHTRRWCCYLKPNGRFKVEEHTDRRDIDNGFEVLRKCGRL